jgi:hypothetical protein
VPSRETTTGRLRRLSGPPCWFVWLAALIVAPLEARSDDWPLEQIWLRGEKQYRGLLLSRSEDQVEFAEIVRPRGKRMYAIIRAIPAEHVVGERLLEAGERATLAERFNAFRNRALIEAGNMESLRLTSVRRDGADYQVYDGPWFTLWSTANEETTRRSIVRIEQSFRGYRQLLPPRVEQQGSFQIYLFGSTTQYRAALDRWNVESGHAAYYVPERNLIVAGTDLDVFAAELVRAAERNEQTRQQLKQLRAAHERTLAEVSSEMKQAGFSSEEIEAEVRSRRAAWKTQHDQLEAAIKEAARKNAARFDSVSRTMFRRLNHEAFHAYLENYVYPRQEADLPRWLNEGLAQIFETAQLDADTLRIDAPSKELLARLQADLRSPSPLSLKELLTADDALLAGHGTRREAQRHYLYAWGLAWHLAFHREGLASGSLDEYVAKTAAERTPIARFERWTGRPLAEFEAEWRREMLSLRE